MQRPLCLLLLIAAAGLAQAGEPRRLTDDGRFKLSPTFTPDGDHVVYAVRDAPNRITFRKLDPESGKNEELLPRTELHHFDIAFSKSNRYWAYTRSAKSPQMQLAIVDRKTDKESVYSPVEFRSGVRNPVIAPDEKRVVFGQSAPGGQQIASIDMQAGDLTLLTRATGINTHPDVSPDGKSIVFASSRDGNLEIYVMKIDGSNVRRLTRSPRLDTHPRFSPDGKQIAFTSRRDGNDEIYVMRADGSSPVNLTNHPERDDFASWSPDGKQIIAVAERDGAFDIYEYAAPQ